MTLDRGHMLVLFSVSDQTDKHTADNLLLPDQVLPYQHSATPMVRILIIYTGEAEEAESGSDTEAMSWSRRPVAGSKSCSRRRRRVRTSTGDANCSSQFRGVSKHRREPYTTPSPPPHPTRPCPKPHPRSFLPAAKDKSSMSLSFVSWQQKSFL